MCPTETCKFLHVSCIPQAYKKGIIVVRVCIGFYGIFCPLISAAGYCSCVKAHLTYAFTAKSRDLSSSPSTGVQWLKMSSLIVMEECSWCVVLLFVCFLSTNPLIQAGVLSAYRTMIIRLSLCTAICYNKWKQTVIGLCIIIYCIA